MPGRQKIWAAAVQKRIAVTSSILGSMRSVKMMGLGHEMTATIQGQRIRELNMQASFRWLIVWMNIMGTYVHRLWVLDTNISMKEACLKYLVRS